MLEENLATRHSARPTHSVDEMQLLLELFPESIEVVTASVHGSVVAGIVLFKTDRVVHAQYIGSTEAGRAASALDAIFGECVRRAMTSGARFFDFGISTEDEGRVLNAGLHKFKSEFGGGGVVHHVLRARLGLTPECRRCRLTTGVIWPNMGEEFSVGTCRLIEFPVVHDQRGNLTFIEGGEHIPFEIKRVYYLYDVPGGATRAGHAHRELEQVMVAASGSFDVIVDDGTSRDTVTLNRSYFGLYVANYIWRKVVELLLGGGVPRPRIGPFRRGRLLPLV